MRTDYSASSSYQRLRDARSQARAEERARDAEVDSEGPEPAAWREVLSVAEGAISSQSKDVAKVIIPRETVLEHVNPTIVPRDAQPAPKRERREKSA